MKLISIIIVAYKSQNILLRCLNSIAEYNDIGDLLEVIVVDNSPENERVADTVKRSNLPGVLYYPADNKGFGAGNNVGARVAQGEILAFMNPDIILIEPIFSQILKAFENKKVALMGGKLLYEDLKSGFSFYYDYKTSIIKKWTLKLWNRLDRFDDNNMFIAGADLIVRRNVFFDAGMFDENIFMYYEEADLTRRIRKLNRGYAVMFCPDIRMIHLEKGSTPSTIGPIKYEMDSAIYYGRKYGLDSNKKIRFEYRYYKIKYYVYKLMNKEKAAHIKNILLFIKDNYLLL